MSQKKDITSQALLKSYLVNSYSTANIFSSKDKFKTILTGGSKKSTFDEETIDNLYDQIVLWKQERIDDVLRAIAHNFSVPEIELETRDERSYDDVVYADSTTLNSLNLQLEKLSSVLEIETKNIEEQVVKELADLKESVEALSDLRFGKLGFSDSVIEAVKELSEFDSLITQQ